MKKNQVERGAHEEFLILMIRASDRRYGRMSWVRFLPGTLKIFSVVPSLVAKQPSLAL